MRSFILSIASAVAMASLLLSACTTVGPDYVPPEPEMPESYLELGDPALKPVPADVKQWWVVFDDPMLTDLIGMAAQGSLDLRIAIARVNEARARLGVVSGQMAPVVGVQGAAVRERTAPANSTQTRFSTGLDAGWEIDLFGRVSRSIEAAGADLAAIQEDRTDVMITLYAEVARTYLSIRTLQARLIAANGNIRSQETVLDLTRKRLSHGLATDLDVAQAEQVLAASESRLPPLRIELNQSINTIAVLLGKQPGTLAEKLNPVRPIPLPPADVAVGVPANLLRQRPDIRRAERQLAAQTARIGVATADLYPTLSLNGSLGLGAINSANLFSRDSLGFSLGPSLRWNLFDGGRVRNQIKVEDARTEQVLLVYERTVLEALNEVENALTAFIEQRIQYEAQERSAAAARRSLQLATALYRDGLIGFQSVVDSQRALFDFENQVAAAQGQAAVNVVRLYKALGGGWNPDEIETAGGTS